MLEKADSGDIVINKVRNSILNKNSGVKILREEITFLFQNFALVDEKSVRYNLEIALRYTKTTKKEKAEHIKNVLKEVGLENYEGEQNISTLRWRVATYYCSKSIIKTI